MLMRIMQLPLSLVQILLIAALCTITVTDFNFSADTTVLAAGNNTTQEDSPWRLLLEGGSMDSWRGYQSNTAPEGWQVVDGVLARVGAGGDIITVDKFTNFELLFEWKLEEGGNSGIFFGVTEEGAVSWHSGPEFQVLHNEGHPDGNSPITSAGSNFAVHPPTADVTRPIGQWNEARLIVNDGHVEHWMNGKHLLSYELGSADWHSRVTASKFVALPLYGKSLTGHIAIQDHGDPVWFRNMKIRVLN